MRRRLVARYGHEVEPWLDTLPPVLAMLGERWQLDLTALIPFGHMSVVIRCRVDARPAVLKICFDRVRLAAEAAALAHWDNAHVPAVIAVDSDLGALLIEAIEPGTMLVDETVFPAAAVADLLHALHTSPPPAAYPPLSQRVAYLFDAWSRHRRLRPELVDVVPPALFEWSRALAGRLAAEPSPVALLHSDLTPVNILDGGPSRGLVAIDPAPCVGDPAYDAIDLLFWNAEDEQTISARADALALPTERALEWCRAFAAMVASELASEGAADSRVRDALALATA